MRGPLATLNRLGLSKMIIAWPYRPKGMTRAFAPVEFAVLAPEMAKIGISLAAMFFDYGMGGGWAPGGPAHALSAVASPGKGKRGRLYIYVCTPRLTFLCKDNGV